MKQLIIIFIIVFAGMQNITAQENTPPPANNKIPKQEIKNGNELYRNKQYKEAQESYGAALMKNPNSYHGLYNMGNTLYQLDDVENARKAYQSSANKAKTKEEKALAWHNAGNTYMKEEKWQEAVNAYKESLRNNPNNANTKYNLAYANAKLKQQQQNQDKNDKKEENEEKKDENKDQNKDQQNKDENKDNKEDNKEDKQEDKQQQDNKEEQSKEEKEERKPQGQPSKLSEKEAENILNALRQEEKKIQEKKNKQKGRPVILEKDW